MSSHPYGLRGDPFASPATLSAKDASRLIRRRVRAFNGDGGALFPIDTCDLIHELAGGIPDAMLTLAGAAMRIAAAEDAAAVSPAHVRQAAATRGTTASEAGEAGVAEPAGDSDRRSAITDRPPLGGSGTDSGIAMEAGDPAPAVAAEAWDDAPAIADDDPDLPEFRPAAFALPSQPSENLDRDARDWVSRFIPAPGAGHAPASSRREHHAAGDTARSAAPAIRAASPSRPAPAPAADAEGAPSLARSFPLPRPRPRGGAPRRRRRSGSQGLLIGVAALCVIAFVVRMSLRGNLTPPATETARPVATAVPTAESRTPDSGPVVAAPAPAASDPAPAPDPAPASLAREDPARDERAASRLVGAPPGPAAPAASSAAARRDPAAGRFGLEVATFIFEERARVERERLAADGLRARLVTTLEYGSRVYRVVVGGYPHPAAAERAADSLLSNGVVLQARVVRIP